MNQSAPRTSTDFRTDINGLRAWAVVAVILYHFGVPGMTGGFVGVDVFFVISGFLMTGIVVRGLERGKFSILSFYMARARRIVPALVGLCAVLMTLGWFWLTPLDYKTLSTQAIYSLSFLSNIQFWREAGYFDTSSHEKWLLHTWSLAVEWQFYLLLPLLLPMVWKLRPGRRTITLVMAIGLLTSLALCVALTPAKATSTFFLLPTRAWEMMAGGMVYLLANQWVLRAWHRQALELAGLGLIGVAILGFDATSPWPGWRALVPVVGAVMVLLAARANTLWTGNWVVQWLGTRSYSLYLWHWPVVVALAYAQLKSDPAVIAFCLLLTLVLGHLSYHWLEIPARQQLVKLKLKWGSVALLAATVVVAVPAAAVQWQQGVLERFSPEIALFQNEALDSNPRKLTCHPTTGVTSPSCMFGGNHVDAILLGDSHGNAVVSAFANAVKYPENGVMEWSYSSCPILQGVSKVQVLQNQCGSFVDWTIQKLASIPSDVPVVVVNRHGLYAFGKNEGAVRANTPTIYFSRPYSTPEPDFLKEYALHLTATACKLAKDRPVYLVRPIPEMGVNVPNTARAMVWGERKEVTISLAEYHQRNGVFWAAQDAARDQCGVKILDPLPYLCWDGVCHGSKDGRPLYYDDNHLSEFGNKLLVPMFAKVFEL
jgi:peptidoglycan/LPS O-acetylase OafA/YrhL